MPDSEQKEQIKQTVKEIMQEEKQQQEKQDPQQQKIMKCVVDCANAKNLCLQTLQHALTLGEDAASAQNIAKLLDCAEMCEAFSGILLRNSELKSDFAKICVKACEECAKMCGEFKDDPQMQSCSEYASLCAESCKKT